MRPGDRILVGAKGKAKLVHSSACITEVTENRPVTVISSSPCEGRMRQSAPANETGIDPTMIIGGAVVAGGAAAAILRNNKGSSPASP